MSIKYLDNGVWSSVPGTAGSYASPTRQHERYTATGAVTAIPIKTPIRPGDMLTVLRDNLPLVEGVDYTRAEHQVTLTVATIAGTVIDTYVTHYDIAPLRSHVDDMADPHHTLAYITQGLQAGDLLKYDGAKLVKAVVGVDYGFPQIVTMISNFENGWALAATEQPLITVKQGHLVSVIGRIRYTGSTSYPGGPAVTLPWAAKCTVEPIVGMQTSSGTALKMQQGAANKVLVGFTGADYTAVLPLQYNYYTDD